MATYTASYNFVEALGQITATAVDQLTLTNTVSSSPIFDYYTGQFYSGPPSQVNPVPHLGQVKFFRKEFKNYSKEEFKTLSEKPVVKEILSGLATIPKEEIAERIKHHLDQIQ